MFSHILLNSVKYSTEGNSAAEISGENNEKLLYVSLQSKTIRLLNIKHNINLTFRGIDWNFAKVKSLTTRTHFETKLFHYSITYFSLSACFELFSALLSCCLSASSRAFAG